MYVEAFEEFGVVTMIRAEGILEYSIGNSPGPISHVTRGVEWKDKRPSATGDPDLNQMVPI